VGSLRRSSSVRRVCRPSLAPLSPVRNASSKPIRRSTLWRAVIAALAALEIALCATPQLALAETPSTSGSSPAEALTQALVAMSARYPTAGPAERRRLENSLLTTAATRLQLLASLMETDPAAVLRAALPAHVRSRLPSRVSARLEQDTQLEGTLEILHEDWPRGGRYHYFIHSTSGRYSLHFAHRPSMHLLTGARIRVGGVQIGTMLALDGSTSIQTVAPAPVPNTFGAQPTLVILVNFQDNPTQPYALSQAQSVVFGTTSNFFLESSYRQTWLAGDVVGWYTIPLASTTCDSGGIATYAETAATAAGVNLSAYTHRVYAFPANAGCGFSGAATVGGNPSRAWINGSGSMSLGTVGHEVGHNLGLLHSHSLSCDGTTMTGTCTTLEYGDGLDIMGWSASGHFNAFQKERLGWLNYGVSPPITTVTASGSYALAPYEAADANPKALKLLRHTDPTTGAREWYYVELRRAIGFDSYLATVGGPYQLLSSNILNGVEIRWASESSSDSSRLLDMTPGSVDPYTGIVDLYTNDPALTVGNSFSDPDAGVTLTVASVDGSAAVVSVTLTTPTCARANPTVAVSPSPGPVVPAGTAVTYTVSVTNNDGASCAASSFSLQTMVLLTGWTAAFAAPTLTLSPGTSTSTTFTVTSPASVTGTSYTFPVVVTNSANGSYQATSSAVYVIGSALGSTLNVAVSTDKPTYTGGQTVSVTARASSGGSPVSNASVTFTMTKSNGAAVSQSATTDSKGSAVGKFRLKRQDPPGGYKARADAVKTPSSGSATTSFTVQ